MGSIISVVVSAVVGLALAVAAALGVISSQTKAPSSNPASVNVVNYGSTTGQ